MWYLKDLSQNWHGYGRPAPPSSSPPVAMPRSQQPSGICEGDATSLLEGEEGTQDKPAGSSSPSERGGDTGSLQGVTASPFFKITAADQRVKTNPIRNSGETKLSPFLEGKRWEKECVEGKNTQTQRGWNETEGGERTRATRAAATSK